MSSLYNDKDRYHHANASPTVEALHAAVHELVRSKLGSTEWQEFVFDTSFELISKEDIKAIEQSLVDAGHRYAWSAAISAQERPEAYIAAEGLGSDDLEGYSFEHDDAIVSDIDASGTRQVGQGDNVARFHSDVEGVVRYIRSPAQVMQYINEGVPENTIAVIDDSGGTLTAPILEHFKGVICAGGSTRSHLGILTREYGVPCLMNAKITDLPQSSRVRLECSADPKTAADYQKNVSRTARIWRLTDND